MVFYNGISIFSLNIKIWGKTLLCRLTNECSTHCPANIRVCTSRDFFKLGSAFFEGEMAELSLKKLREVQTQFQLWTLVEWDPVAQSELCSTPWLHWLCSSGGEVTMSPHLQGQLRLSPTQNRSPNQLRHRHMIQSRVATKILLIFSLSVWDLRLIINLN